MFQKDYMDIDANELNDIFLSESDFYVSCNVALPTRKCHHKTDFKFLKSQRKTFQM